MDSTKQIDTREQPRIHIVIKLFYYELVYFSYLIYNRVFLRILLPKWYHHKIESGSHDDLEITDYNLYYETPNYF